jgi:hypothetical protein
MNKNAVGRFSFWLSHYYDDFTSSFVVADDLNTVAHDTTHDHTKTHFGNPINSESTMNPRYRFSIVERNALSTKLGVTHKQYLHNKGSHEWLTFDPMRLHSGDYPGYARMTFPDSYAHGNRFCFRVGGSGHTRSNSETGTEAYMWIANGNECTMTQNAGFARGRYWVPLGHREVTMGRANIIRRSFGTGSAGSGGSRSYFASNRGLAGDTHGKNDWHQSTHLTGCFAGEYVPMDQNADIDNETNTVNGGWGTPYLLEPIYSPSGKPFLCLQSYIPKRDNDPVGRTDNNYTPVIGYEGNLGLKQDNDVFTIRMNWNHFKIVDPSGSPGAQEIGNHSSVTHANGTYYLRVGFSQEQIQGGTTTLGESGYSPANGTPVVSTSGSAGAPTDVMACFVWKPHDSVGQPNFQPPNFIKSEYPHGGSATDRTYTLDDMWFDIDLVFNWTNQTFTVYVDGNKDHTLGVGGIKTYKMGAKTDGSPWAPEDAVGWDLFIDNESNTTNCMFVTNIDRVAAYTPFTEDPIGTELPLNVSASLTQGVNSGSSMKLKIADDSNTHASLFNLFTTANVDGVYSDSKLMLFLNSTNHNVHDYNYRTRPLWQGKISNFLIKQNNSTQEKNIELTATDVSRDLDKELVMWAGVETTQQESSDWVATRSSEIVALNETLLFGARRLLPLNQTIGFGREQGYEETSDQRMQLGSGHPIQLYNNEDVNGPNNAEVEWETHSSGVPSGVTAADIENRSIHAEWVRDIAESNWFKKKFGNILNYKHRNQLWFLGIDNTIHTHGTGTNQTVTTSTTRTDFGIVDYRQWVLLQQYHDKGHTIGEFSSSKNMRNQIPTEYVSGVISNLVPDSTIKTVSSISDSNGHAQVNCTSHGFSAGDFVMIYDYQNLSGLGEKKVEYQRTVTGGGTEVIRGTGFYTQTSETAVTGDAGYLLDVENGMTCFMIVQVNTNSFKIKPIIPEIGLGSIYNGRTGAGGVYYPDQVMYAGNPGTAKCIRVRTAAGVQNNDDIQVHYTAGQFPYSLSNSHRKYFQLRFVDDSFKHIWILFADMRNNGDADADGGGRTKEFGMLHPIADNYTFSIVSDDDISEGVSERNRFVELKVGEDIDLWEIDATNDPDSGAHWGTGRSGTDWSSKAGSFLVIDASPFFNLNTENNGGNAWTLSGGKKDMGEYMIEVEGNPVLIDSYWRNAPPTHRNSESPLAEHTNAGRFVNELTILDQRAANATGSTQYISTGDTVLYVNNAHEFPITCFSETTGLINHVGMIRAISTGTGEDAGFVDYYYTYIYKSETTTSGAVALGASSVALTSSAGFPTSGTGTIDGETFSWTGISTNTLIGVTGISRDHDSGVVVSDNRLIGFFMDYIDPEDVDTYDEILQTMQNRWNANRTKIELFGANASAGATSFTTPSASTAGVPGAGLAESNNNGNFYDAMSWSSSTGSTNLSGVKGMHINHYGGSGTNDEAYISPGSLHSLEVKGSDTTVANAYDTVRIYSSTANIYPMRLMMEVTGHVKSPQCGTFWESDKIRYLDLLPFLCNWVTSTSSYCTTGLGNMPKTNNMDVLHTGAAASNYDDFGSILDSKNGGSFLSIYRNITDNIGIGSTGTNTTLFSWMVGRDNKLELRPSYSTGWVFNRDNLRVSDLSVDIVDTITNVRVYYNKGASFVDYPAAVGFSVTARKKWSIVNVDSVITNEEALSLAKQEYEKRKEPSVKVKAEIIRHGDEHTWSGSNSIMTFGGRYGYVADQTIRNLGPYVYNPSASCGGCLFPGMVNAMDGNLQNANNGSSHGYGTGWEKQSLASATTPSALYAWNEDWGHYGSKSVSYAMDVVHIPHKMPVVSEETGNHLRICISPTGDGSDTVPEFRVELIDPIFNETKSAGDSAAPTAHWGFYSGKPMLNNVQSGDVGTHVTSADFLGNGYLQISVPSSYWSSVGDNKIILSMNYDYLHSLLKYKCGSTNGTLSSSIRKGRHRTYTLTYGGSYNADSIFPLGIAADNSWGGFVAGVPLTSAGRALWYAPRLIITDDLNFIPGQFVKYTDSHLGLSNQSLFIESLTWRIDTGTNNERLSMSLNTSRKGAGSSVVGAIFPDISRGRGNGGQQRPGDNPLPPPKDPHPRPNPPDGRPPNLPPFSEPPNTPIGDSFSPMTSGGQQSGTGGDMINGNGLHTHMTQGGGSGSTQQTGVNNLTDGMFGNIRGKMDLGDTMSEGFGILGAPKPKRQPTSTHSIEAVDSHITSIGDSLATEEGIILPGSTGSGEKNEAVHTTIIRIPRDIGNGGFSVVANLSLGGSSGLATLYTTVECIETGATLTHTRNISADTTAENVSLLPYTTLKNSAGNRLKVTITRKTGTGDDDLYFSAVRLHTLNVTYERRSVTNDKSGTKDMRPYD